MAAIPLHDELRQITALQGRLTGVVAVLIGLAATAAVLLPALWQTSQHLNTMAHEGGHALMGVLMGHQVESLRLNSRGEGATVTAGPRGFGLVLVQFVGYLNPGLLGLGAAKLIGRPRLRPARCPCGTARLPRPRR